MPTYDYECKECGHLFEEFHAMSDPPVDTCPECSGDVRRLIGGGLGIIFKGSGFYVTDNRSSGSGSSVAAKTSSKTQTGNAGESKSSDNSPKDSPGDSRDKSKVRTGKEVSSKTA